MARGRRGVGVNERVAGGSTWATRCGGEREGSGRVNVGDKVWG